jgi:integrase
MQKRAFTSADSETICLSDFREFFEGWMLDGEVRANSPHTQSIRRFVFTKFLWYCRHFEVEAVSSLTIRQFLAYLVRGHEQEGGRWGNPRETQPVKPATVHGYYRVLRAFCNWCVEEGLLALSPMAAIKPPIVRSDQVQPFTPEQIAALIQAAKRALHPRRDEAILLFLLDTGVRASELCGLRRENLDPVSRSARILGKGGKERTVYFGAKTARVLWQYLREEPPARQQAVFRADRGVRAGEALTPSGLLRLIRRLGQAAHIGQARCSPHTFRHTFAIEFLRNGGNQFTLMQLLGHTDLAMTARYVALAQADIARQHRHNSPVDRLQKKRGG